MKNIRRFGRNTVQKRIRPFHQKKRQRKNPLQALISQRVRSKKQSPLTKKRRERTRRDAMAERKGGTIGKPTWETVKRRDMEKPALLGSARKKRGEKMKAHLWQRHIFTYRRVTRSCEPGFQSGKEDCCRKIKTAKEKQS